MTALSAHRAWCGNPGDTAPEHVCATPALRLDFGRVALSADQVEDLTLGLERDPDFGNQCAVLINGCRGFSLAPDQMRPLAMGLLAQLATLTGDTDLAGFYRAEALRGSAGV
jgi:hypothetical protein